MLSWIASLAAPWFGPSRLFGSYFFMASLGFAVCAAITFVMLPRITKWLPRDGGRAFAVNAEASVGKPVGAGLFFVSLFCLMALLFLPLGSAPMLTIPLMLAATVIGYIDDKRGGLSELTLGSLDAVLALGAACAIYGFHPVSLWLPIWRETLIVPAFISIPLGAAVVWLSINATNCSDGVDGVSGSLSGFAILMLGGLLYAILGNAPVSQHLRVVFNPQGAEWSIYALLMVGCLAGYLWHNAPPSALLMGDAGSRPLGLLIGMLVLATNNPLFIVIIGPMLLLNGATGLVKVALIRLVGLRIFPNVRFPLHDHFRKEMGWSNAQVLVRFIILQVGITSLLVLVSLKIR